MNKTRLLFVLIFAAGILVAPGHTQEKPKTAPKPAPSASEAVLEQWNEIGRKLIAIAEDFPEDKYDFKPTPAVRSFAERLIHAAYANQFLSTLCSARSCPEWTIPNVSSSRPKLTWSRS